MAWYNYIVAQFSKSFDKSTTAINIIDYAHHEIHSGSHYSFTHITTVAQGGGTYTYRMVTPNTTKWVHLIGQASCDQGFTLTFREGTTFSAPGTAGTPINRNRNSTNTAGLVVAYGATVDAAGTVLYASRQGARGVGQEARANNEYVLKQNTAYDITITNHTAGTAANATIILDWYEHTDRNI